MNFGSPIFYILAFDACFWNPHPFRLLSDPQTFGKGTSGWSLCTYYSRSKSVPHGLAGKPITVNWSLILQLERPGMVISLCVNHGHGSLGPETRGNWPKVLACPKVPREILVSIKRRWPMGTRWFNIWFWVAVAAARAAPLHSGLTWADFGWQTIWIELIKRRTLLRLRPPCEGGGAYHHELLVLELMVVGAVENVHFDPN